MSLDMHVWSELESLRVNLTNIQSLVSVNLTRIDSLFLYFLNSSKSTSMKGGDMNPPSSTASKVLSLPSTNSLSSPNLSLPPLPSPRLGKVSSVSCSGSDVSNQTPGIKEVNYIIKECHEGSDSEDETILSSRPKGRRILQRVSKEDASVQATKAERVKTQPTELKNQESTPASRFNPLGQNFEPPTTCSSGLFSTETLYTNDNLLSEDKCEKSEYKSPRPRAPVSLVPVFHIGVQQERFLTDKEGEASAKGSLKEGESKEEQLMVQICENEANSLLVRGGALIKKISWESGAFITVRGKRGANIVNRELDIFGTREQINKAMAIFQSKYEQLTIPVSDYETSSIVGRGGAVVNKICSDSGAIINVYGKRGNTRELNIMGTREQIREAMTIIQSGRIWSIQTDIVRGLKARFAEPLKRL